jgi:aryl-alcohol dehydrogenase
MEITAAVTRTKGGEARLERLVLDEPRPDEVLVRVIGVGICHADLFIRDQIYPVELPVVLGHEASGVVERVGGEVVDLAVGDHVVVTYNSCGACESCAEGEPQYCHDFYRRNFACERDDGSSPFRGRDEVVRGYFFGQSSFASHILVPGRSVVKVPNEAPLELLGPLACGVQTGAGAIMQALAVPAGRSVAIYGVGSVGLSAVMAARLRGASPIVAVDRESARLDMARELGATHVVDAERQDVVAEVRRASGQGTHFALDTTGSPAVIRQAVDALAVRGVCGTVGGNSPETEVSLNLIHMMASGRTFRGIVEGDVDPHTFIPELIALQREGRLPFDRIIRTYPFSQINQAIADVEAAETIKAVLLMGTTP